MVHQNHQSEQAKSRLMTILSALQIGKLLRESGISKSFGLTSLEVFKLIFSLVFEGRNWFRLLESDRKNLPGKDVVYRFLNHRYFAWREFLLALSLKIVLHFETLIASTRVRVFIIDDSVLQRNRSKKAELLARVFDHTTGRFVKGFNMLTLGWSDGFSFAPIDFVMLSSANITNRLSEMVEGINKRCQGYKRRIEAFSRKPDSVVDLIDRAISSGFSADFVLMDSWFTQAPLLRQLLGKGLHVIGMIKDMKQRYLLNGKRLNLQELYAMLPKHKGGEILGSIIVKTSCGLSVKLVFVQNRNKRREWLVVLSTDITLEDAEIIRIYGMRWSIETFFKFTKSYLKLGSEFQGRSFDMLISHTTIVFSRYLVMEWERRQENDEKSLGGLFFLFSDEVRDLDLASALQQLMTFFMNVAEAKTKRNKQAVIRQVLEWITGLPNYIKGLLPQLSCES